MIFTFLAGPRKSMSRRLREVEAQEHVFGHPPPIVHVAPVDGDKSPMDRFKMYVWNEWRKTGLEKRQNLLYVSVSSWHSHDCQLFIGSLIRLHTLLQIQIHMPWIERNVKWLRQTLALGGGTEILEQGTFRNAITIV
jgi:hypothetical protein